MKAGYCAVTGDLLHKGHIYFIDEAASCCDYLTVGIMTDECVKGYKGAYPIMNERERMLIVGSLKKVDNVEFQDTFEVKKLLTKGKYDVFIDSEMHFREVPEGCDKILVSYYPNQSSTDIKKRIIRHAENINNS